MANSVLYDIFHNSMNEAVHSEFIKFSKGVFVYRYLINAKKQKNGWNIKTSAEFANYLVRMCLSRISGTIAVSGAIISTLDMRSEVEKVILGVRVKQFMGIKQLIFNTDAKAQDILALMNRFPRAFFALSFATETSQLKIKAKAPKSAKPATNGEKEPSADFCTLKTSDEEIVRDLFFDVPVFKEISIKHTITISDIILPKDISDPAQMREKAVRKGFITRVVIVDGKENRSEAKLEV